MKRINLIPKETASLVPKELFGTNFFKFKIIRISVTLVGIFVFIYIFQGMMLARYKTLVSKKHKEIEKIESEIRKSQATLTKIENEKSWVKKELTRIEEKISVLYIAERERYAWTGVLEHLSEIIPDDVWINRLEVSEKIITINGTAVDNRIISEFMNKIDTSSYFKNTSFNYTEKVVLEDKNFIDFEVTTNVVISKIER